MRASGLRIHNLVRDVEMPWPHVDVVESRWNLKVFTPDDKGYSAWAISTQRPRRSGGGAGGPLGALGALGTAGADRLTGARGESTDDAVKISRVERPGSAGDVADQVKAAREEYDKAVSSGAIEAQTGPVVVRPAPLAVGAVAVAVVLILIALFA
ncbi:hypothetical protein VV02_10185 [Luteipulveratus mongoliensis]|uniref:Uncharacterized protein n=2 Tax=Luteipulveratus mongoliensis TaxID=571913 RepID=A0A0K1JHG9_9MICO|nr:hypothetical protein VV02_10185 [Luteipulveratus mongoliensis]